MSILQDLDPQYAKIHAQPSSAWKPVIASGTALIVLGAAYWGIMQTRADPIWANRTPATHPSQASLVPDEMQKHAIPAPEPLAKLETSDAIGKSTSTTPGAAIRDDTQGTIATEDRTLKPTRTDSPDSAAGSLADGEYRRQTQAVSSHAKTTHTHSVTKQAHKSAAAQPTAKNERSQLSGGKKTNERDIDIITAIVR